MLLSYDNGNKESVISSGSVSGGVQASKGYSIGTGEDIEEPIINHFIRTGRQYPFEAGKVSNGLYFFNGFYNYTFSLVFTTSLPTIPLVSFRDNRTMVDLVQLHLLGETNLLHLVLISVIILFYLTRIFYFGKYFKYGSWWI